MKLIKSVNVQKQRYILILQTIPDQTYLSSYKAFHPNIYIQFSNGIKINSCTIVVLTTKL